MRYGTLKAPFPWFGGKSRVAHRERIWFSPHCLKADLFSHAGAVEDVANDK